MSSCGGSARRASSSVRDGNGAGYDSSGGALTDRRWIYEYDARAEAVAIA